MIYIQLVICLLILVGIGILLITKNVIHSTYALALVLVATAGIYVLLKADLLAVVQILLYAGGVVILLAFGVMMTNRMSGNKLVSESRNKGIAAIISILTFFGLIFLFSNHAFSDSEGAVKGNQIEQIGVIFLTDQILAFELIAFILLVVLVGASYLAKSSSDE